LLIIYGCGGEGLHAGTVVRPVLASSQGGAQVPGDAELDQDRSLRAYLQFNG